jgi:Trm5-related predicted tRNA methylase
VTLQSWEHVVFVKDEFEQIRDQIHEIRNFLWPLELKLESLDHQVTKSRIFFEAKASELESKIAQNASEIALQSERIKRIELLLKIPQTVEKSAQAPVREDKANPGILPPQTPA